MRKQGRKRVLGNRGVTFLVGDRVVKGAYVLDKVFGEDSKMSS